MLLNMMHVWCLSIVSSVTCYVYEMYNFIILNWDFKNENFRVNENVLDMKTAHVFLSRHFQHTIWVLSPSVLISIRFDYISCEKLQPLCNM